MILEQGPADTSACSWRVLIWPAVLALAWAGAGQVLCCGFSVRVAPIVIQSGRVLIAGFAGWLAMTAGARSVWLAAWAGPAMLFADHVVFNAGTISAAWLAGAITRQEEAIALVGIVVSYMVFAPVALLPAWAGAALARHRLPASRRDVPLVPTHVTGRNTRRTLFRGLLLLTIAWHIADGIVSTPLPPVTEAAKQEMLANWGAESVVSLVYGIGQQAAIAIGAVGVFLFWGPARFIYAIIAGLSLTDLPLDSAPRSWLMFGIGALFDLAIVGLSFSTPLRTEFSRRVGLRRVAIIGWLAYSATLVVTGLAFWMFRQN